MLRKLLKWEIKATARIFVPLYITLLLFTLVNRFLNPFEMIAGSGGLNFEMILGFLGMITYFALIVGMVVITLLIVLQRFYKGLLQDEGYLMFTLPAATWQHVVSKLTVASLWSVLSTLTAFVSVLLIARVEDIYEVIIDVFRMAQEYLGTPFLLLLPIGLLLIIAMAILMIYAALTLGHTYSKHKLMASFGMYGLLYIINQALIVTTIVGFGRRHLQNLLASSQPTPVEAMKLLVFYILFSALLSATYFAITNWLLKRKLNLE